MTRFEMMPVRHHVVVHPQADTYARQNWRFHARSVNAYRHLDVDNGERVRYAEPLHWVGLIHAMFGLPNWLKLRQKMIRIGVTAVLILGCLAFVGAWPAQVVLLAITLIHSGCMVWRILSWQAASVIVTNQRLICPRGLLSRSVASTQLHRIGDHEYIQSLLGRWLGYGTLRIETGGRHDNGADRELIRWVRSPEVVDRMLGRWSL